MFFSNKLKDGNGKPELEATSNRRLADDVVDVVDVTELDTPSTTLKRTDTEFIPEPNAASRGLFLDAEASTDAPTAANPGLRDRFKRKPIAPQGPSTEATPVLSETVGESSKKKWFSRAEAIVTMPTVSELPDNAVRQTRPTADVKKPIIVSKVSDKKKKRMLDLPIRVLIGFLPEVSERDARDYARGIAERNCEQISLAYFDAFKLNNGFAYEVHEGGPGKAYLPEIIKFFASKGTFAKGGDDVHAFITTSTRTVQVDRTRDGLQAFLLPESSTQEDSDWLDGTTKMSPAVHTMAAVLIAGSVLFTTGFLTLTLALVSRIQPYDPPLAPVLEKATDAYNLSPASRWGMLQSVQGSEYVKALRFTKGKWELERGIEGAPTTRAPPNQTGDISGRLPPQFNRDNP